MANRGDNKLEVQLKLLKSEELAKLGQFSAAFASTAGRFENALDKHASRVEKALLNMVANDLGINIGQTSTMMASSMAAGGTQIYAQQTASDGKSARTAALGAGSAAQQPDNSLQGHLHNQNYNEEVWLGTLMSNPVRAFSTQPIAAAASKWAMGRLAGSNLLQSIDSRIDPNTFMGRRALSLASTVNWAQNNPQAIAAGIMTMGGMYMTSNMAASGYRAYGRQAGLETAYGFGALPVVGWGSEAGWQGFKASVSDRLASLSPTVSIEDRQRMRQMAASMGRSEDLGRGVISRAIQHGASDTAIMAYLDNARRHRPDRIGEINDDLENLGKAAKAAGLGLTEMQDQTVALASHMSQALGSSSYDATKYSLAASGFGLTPQNVQGLASRQNVMRTVAMSGGSGGFYGGFYKASSDLTLQADVVAKRARMMGLGDLAHYTELQRKAEDGDVSAQQTVGRLNYIMSSPSMQDMFGGLDPSQIERMMSQSGRDAAAAQEEIYTAGRNDKGLFNDRGRMRRILEQGGVFKKSSTRKKAEELLSNIDKMSVSETQTKMTDLIARASGVAAQGDKDSKPTLGLTDEAKKLVKILDAGGKASKIVDRNLINMAIPGASVVGTSYDIYKKLT